ncbi:MAG: division/cell wall cluster transcriptional repressor MraZ [Anaerolineaceae bacterium]|nr:division/cell wall cluster transcriptional repressor MraZ [Anaerolineaceae bacterium]
MFTGIYEHTIDKKGRTSMPARFRNELGGEAYLSVGIDKNLVIYSTAHFNAMAEEIGKLSLADPTARIYRRRMFNKAEFIEIDANGRFLIPQFLRDELSAEAFEKVVFAGSNDYIEIWTAEGWAHAEAEAFHDEAMTANFARLMNAQWGADD